MKIFNHNSIKTSKMKTKSSVNFVLMVFASLLLISRCSPSRVTLKTFVDPSLQSNSIKSIVAFPLRNMALSPGEGLELDRSVTQAFFKKNPNVKIMGTSEATLKLNEYSLVEDYTHFLEDFEHSGIPNTAILKKIGDKLGVDAILQGRLSDIKQNDASYGVSASTSLSLRYTLLNTLNGNTIWEGTSNARLDKTPAWSKAPPLYEVIEIAHKKILTGMPVLGK